MPELFHIGDPDDSEKEGSDTDFMDMIGQDANGGGNTPRLVQDAGSDLKDPSPALPPELSSYDIKKAKADSHEHQFTHRSFRHDCDICVRARGQRARHARGKLDLGPQPTNFGDQVTGDSLIDRHGKNPEDPFFPNASNAFVIYDRATDWTDVFCRSPHV